MTRIQIFESARSEAGRNAQNRLAAMAEVARALEPLTEAALFDMFR